MSKNIYNAIEIQREASNPKHNVYLSASAGTGKTKTLIDRIMRLLLDGVKIENILCIAFTNTAANEMLDRLRARLEKWNCLKDNELKDDIAYLIGNEVSDRCFKRARELYNIYLDHFDKCRIQTLHSFCVDILSRAHYIDEDELDKIKIIDDYTRKNLIESAYEKVIKSSHTKVEIDFAINKLAHKYEYSSLLQLLNSLLLQKQKLYNFINSETSIQNLIEEQYKFYGVVNKNINSGDILDKFLAENPEKLIQYVNDLAINDQNNNTVNVINHWFKMNIKARKDYLNSYIDCFLTKNMSVRKKLPFDKNFINNNKIFIDLYKNEQQRVMYFLEEKNVQEQAEFMKCVIIFLNQIIYEYEKLKKEFGYLEYDDLILRTLELFEGSNDIEVLLFSLNLTFSHILLDEAQDISDIQWILIEKIIGTTINQDNTIFIVGDYKQSVYGFQGAEPEHFLKISKFYKAKFHTSSQSWKNLKLFHSFRSRKEILQAVDKTFNTLKFADKFYHVPIREGVGVVKIFEYSYKEPERIAYSNWVLPQEDDNIMDKKRHNSQELANFILYLLSDENKKNKLYPQDIMVLFRKRSKRIDYLVEELKQNNVPVSKTNKISLNENILILDLLSLIKFFLLPEDDFNLVGVLKSVLFNFTEDDIFRITYNRENKSIWSILQSSHHSTTDFLLKIKGEFENTSLYQFYTNLLYQYKFIDNFHREWGRNCQEIIDTFLDKVLEFEAVHQRGAQSFLEWIRYNSEITTQSIDTQGIQIMTVHAAKGLQSPIVIIADASDSENLPTGSYFWYDNKLVVQYSNQYEINALAKMKQERNEKARKESLRLFYVAMTRAENELYIFGDTKGRKDSWYSIVKSVLSENFVLYNNLSSQYLKLNIPYERRQQNNLPAFFKEDHIGVQINKYQTATKKEQLYSDLAVIRGNFIHKIFCDIGKFSKQHIDRYIKKLGNSDSFEIISANEINEIIKITQEIVQKFPDIFYGINILSEVSVRCDFGGSKISVLIDKLIVNEEGIDIIEVKSDKTKKITSKLIPIEYQNQLQIYKKCVASLYPNKKIKCKIFSFYQQDIIDL